MPKLISLLSSSKKRFQSDTVIVNSLLPSLVIVGLLQRMVRSNPVELSSHFKKPPPERLSVNAFTFQRADMHKTPNRGIGTVDYAKGALYSVNVILFHAKDQPFHH